MEHNNTQEKVRVRFAPSPTGFLHIGGVRTALFNWLYAKRHKGTFILRIEDTDTERSTKEFIDKIIEGLTWVGIDWDEGPYLQTDRDAIYKRYAQRLLEEGKAYRCYCTAAELEDMRKEALSKGEKPKYSGKCREINEILDKPFVIRFKTPAEGELIVADMIKGDVSFDSSELDDLIIMRSNGTPTYNFVVVVDDAEMGITHVIRGDDHLANTPRQMQLYKGLGLPMPKFAHLPMILGSDKARLSKRHGATSVLEYRDMGYLPEALINYLVRLGWSHGDQEIFKKDELIEYFDVDHINNSPAVFNPEKLSWLNSHYIKTVPARDIAKTLKGYLKNAGIIKDDSVHEEEIEKLVPLLNERSKTLVEMAEGMRFYFQDNFPYEEEGRKKFFNRAGRDILSELLSSMNAIDSIDKESIENMFKKIIEKTGAKMVNIAQPARLALTGKTVSPGIFEVIAAIGRERSLKRIKAAIDSIPL